jgi:hypothetical protein
MIVCVAALCIERAAAMTVNLIGFGAGSGNRTRIFSLEGCCSTTELYPRRSLLPWPPLKSEAAVARSGPAVVEEVGFEPT